MRAVMAGHALRPRARKGQGGGAGTEFSVGIEKPTPIRHGGGADRTSGCWG